MIPQIRVTLRHLPLPTGAKIGFPPAKSRADFAGPKGEFSWFERIDRLDMASYEDGKAVLARNHVDVKAKAPIDEEGVDMKRYTGWIASSCRNGYNPFQLISKVLASKLDVNVPSSNAFAKMLEICYEPEVSSLLRSHAEHGKPLDIVCLAEAPGTFPIAILYWLANKYPAYMMKHRRGDSSTPRWMYDYRCTSLPPPEMVEKGTVAPVEKSRLQIEGEALGDTYDLISGQRDKWYFMDHTSSKDTRGMYERLGANAFPLVTGDIGLSPRSWMSSESALFRIDLGQFIGACCLLSEGGVATLKGFMFGGKASLGIIRLAMAFFEKTLVYKPRSSRMNNNEMYLVLSGFKVKPFLSVREDLLRLMDEAGAIDALFELTEKEKELPWDAQPFPHFPSFLSDSCFTDELSDRFYRYMMSSAFHRIHIDILSNRCLESHLGHRGEPYVILKQLTRDLYRVTGPLLEEWQRRFPVSRLGQLFHRLTGISSRQKPRAKPTWVKKGGALRSRRDFDEDDADDDAEDDEKK